MPFGLGMHCRKVGDSNRSYAVPASPVQVSYIIQGIQNSIRHPCSGECPALRVQPKLIFHVHSGIRRRHWFVTGILGMCVVFFKMERVIFLGSVHFSWVSMERATATWLVFGWLQLGMVKCDLCFLSQINLIFPAINSHFLNTFRTKSRSYLMQEIVTELWHILLWRFRWRI